MGNYEDDFLEEFMEDVMTIDEDVKEVNKDTSIQEEETINNTHNENMRERKRSGGLLGKFSVPENKKEEGAIESEVEINSNKGVQNPNKGIHDDKVEEHNHDTKNINETQKVNGGLSLIERMRSRDNTVKHVSEDAVDEFVNVDNNKKSVIPINNDLDASKESSSGEVEDSIEQMLDGLEESEDIELAKRKNQLDKDVEVPLEVKGMNDIIVTPDGRSLSEMLPSLRGGAKKTSKIIEEIKNQESVVHINGQKFSDSRYTKHIDKVSEERARDEERIKLSMKYLQRNARFTEQEKVIMRNLGLTSEQLSKVMRSQELSKKEKEELLTLGRYGSEAHFKGKRYRTTVGDTTILEFLSKFKFANTRILRWLSNEPQDRTWRKLNRLRDRGLVESQSLIGVPDLWGATPVGIGISGYSYEPGLRPMPKMISISSNMGVNYLAACLWFNTVNVLNLPDFPAHNRVIALQKNGRDRVRGEMLVSEYEIRRSLGKEISPESTTMKKVGDERLYDIIAMNVREEIDKWNKGGRVGDSPEFMIGNEYMWVLYPTSQLTLSYHVPDLIVKRERGANGEPRSIAVEVERFDKSNDRYDKIMLAYKLDEHLYERVIWVTPNTRVARALERAAKEVGFERYSIIPIITETGVYDKPDIWMI